MNINNENSSSKFLFLASLKKNKNGIILIIISSILVSLGQMFWKLSEGQINFFLISGFILYGIGAILMTISFKFGSFSVLHPMLTTSYIFALFLGHYFLKETISVNQIIGVLIIISGVISIGIGDA